MTFALVVLVGGLVIASVILSGRALDSRSWSDSLLAYRLTMPAGLEIEAVTQWLAALAALTQAPRLALLPGPCVVFEVTASRQGVDHVLLMPRRLEASVLSSLRAALPGVRLSEYPNYRDQRPRCRVAGELTMTNRLRPLGAERGPGTNAAILAALQPLSGTESVILQWILTSAGTPAPIASSGGRGTQQTAARLLIEDELADPEAVRAARLKQAEPILAVSGRLGVAADSKPAAYRLFRRTFGPLRGLNAQGVMVIRRWWLPSSMAAERLRRILLPVAFWPLRLRTSELAGLLGMPTGDLALPGLTLGAARQLPPPPDMATARDAVVIGTSNYPGLPRPIRLRTEDRLMHAHVVGPTGVGKSTLLANLILQDAAAGRGLICIDPKSDLVADVLDRLPEHRLDDVIVLDPAAVSEPVVSFNILQAGHDEHSRELVVDHVIHVWHELYKDFWGPRSEDVLRSAVLTLINTKAADGSAFTLIETPELLTNSSFRRFVLSQPTVPPGVKSFWSWYQRLKPLDQLKVIGPIQNKLRAATLRSPIRLMLGQSRGLDLARVLAERRILLVPLSGGRLGSETAGLLGTLLLSSVYQALLGRSGLPSAARTPVMVFIDEAQSVLRLPVDLADMLAVARGMGGGFTLAHQHLGQLTDKEVKAALFGTVRSQIVFQCGRNDATVLAKSFGPHLTADDLSGLPAFEIAVRPCINGQSRTPLTASTAPLPPPVRDGRATASASRARYGTPRLEVERAIAARLTVPGRPAGSSTSTAGNPGIGRRPRPDRGTGGPA